MSKRVRAKSKKKLKIGDLATLWNRGEVKEVEVVDIDRAINEYLVCSSRPNDLLTFWVRAERLRAVR